MNEILVKSGVEIDLGKRGEHLARCIVFDISGWQKTYGDGSVHLLHQRNGDKAPYPCVVETDGPCVRWLLSETDVDVAGRGRAELQYFVGDARVKSETWNTRTNRSMNNEGPIPEEPAVSWLNAMLQLGTETQENAEIAEQSAAEANESASAAQVAKSEAESVAAEAEQSRVAAEQAKTDAQNAAESAANDAAAKVENDLRDLVADGEAAKLDAEKAKASAVASAQVAAKHESEAEGWANKAQSYAEQAAVPAAPGVYNVVLADRVTAERYALIVEDGRLKLLGVSNSLDAADLTLIDSSTGASYSVEIDSGKLILKEV